MLYENSNKIKQLLLSNTDVNNVRQNIHRQIYFNNFDKENRLKELDKNINEIINDNKTINLPWYKTKINIVDIMLMMSEILLIPNISLVKKPNNDTYKFKHNDINYDYEKISNFIIYLNLYFNLGLNTKKSEGTKLAVKIHNHYNDNDYHIRFVEGLLSFITYYCDVRNDNEIMYKIYQLEYLYKFMIEKVLICDKDFNDILNEPKKVVSKYTHN